MFGKLIDKALAAPGKVAEAAAERGIDKLTDPKKEG